jgi:hypothetical protein
VPPSASSRLTPGILLKPWSQPWQVCFIPCWQHWTMRPFRMKPPFQHVFLLRPFEQLDAAKSCWIYVEWSFMGAVVRLLGVREAAPMHEHVMGCGAMLWYPGSDRLPAPHMANGLWPLTCVTFVRQVLGLPFRYRIWTPQALWDELLERGGTIVVAPK